MVWFRNNKAAAKWTEDEVISIFEQALQYLTDNETITLKTELNLYLLTEHSVCQSTRKSWINNIYSDNKSVSDLWEAIELTIENRVVRENTLRPNIQALVLQNKHNYAEKKESKIKGNLDIKSLLEDEEPGDI